MRSLGQQRDIAPPEVLVLASASPRRRDLLREAGISFEVVPSHVPEVVRDGELPVAFAQRTARAKASEVAERRPGRWILAADTVVVIDGRVLGKPDDARHAREMLRRLSGRTHEVVTAFVLMMPGSRHATGQAVTTRVTFHPLSDETIDGYVASGEPFGKAGAYAIQGAGRALVAAWEGSWTNVVGLPIDEVRAALRKAGG